MKTGAELVSIFEGRNATLKERALGMTMLLPEELQRRLGLGLPASLERWRPEHDVTFRVVEYTVPRGQAASYTAQYRKSHPALGWQDLEDLITL